MSKPSYEICLMGIPIGTMIEVFVFATTNSDYHNTLTEPYYTINPKESGQLKLGEIKVDVDDNKSGKLTVQFDPLSKRWSYLPGYVFPHKQ